MAEPTDTTGERRHFSRIPLEAPAHLSAGAERRPVTVLDISLNGVLISTPEDWEITSGTYTLTVELAPQATITMQCEPAHEEAGRTGFHCLSIDLDSVSHLRRLVELNLGDHALLSRELAELASG